MNGHASKSLLGAILVVIVASIAGAQVSDCSEASEGTPCADQCVRDGECDESGYCIGDFVAEGTSCDDLDPCTYDDKCDDEGFCTGDDLCPDDGNDCTEDCVDGLCGFPDDSAECSDGNECTTGDHCSGGHCLTTGVVSCDDQNACTADACDPASGSCVHVFEAHCLVAVLATLDGGRCGDGSLDAGEDCDDGNTADRDCCSATCQFEAAGTLCAGGCDPRRCDGSGHCRVP